MCLAVKQKNDYEQVDEGDEFKIENCDDEKIQNLNHDVLFILTYYTKIVLCLLNSVSVKLQNSAHFKLLIKTSQPAHLITLISAIILAKILTPNEKINDMSTPPIFTKLLYLASVSAHFGIQIWMTFVSGLALYLCVPRHTFGEVQKVLFPKYFLINAILSLITLTTFMQCQEDQTNQIIGLVICFCVELVIRLYLAPDLVKLTVEKNIMEAAAGVGMEIGKHKAGSLAKCPVYKKLHKTFRKVHMTIAIGNMITIACTTFHLYYLSYRISI